MVPSSTCPSPGSFQQLLAGRLSSAQVEDLSQHLEQCTTCTEVLSSLLLEEDQLLSTVRCLPAGQGLFDSPVVRDLMAQFKQLGPPDFAAGSGSGSWSGSAGVEEKVRSEIMAYLAPAQQPDELGRLGPYRVLKVLAGGGMGLVLRAEDPQLQRTVALKVMRRELAACEVNRRRFLREARAVAALEHLNILTIYQVGEERGNPYFAMPLLKGESLQACLDREGKLSVAETVRIGRQIADGLAAAHDQGLIHRDVKPGNLWLEAGSGLIKILDFGLARVTSADEVHVTATGTLLGTPAYMAPEQAAGEPLDQRCDLYSLGVVLYRMCTGELPFQGNNTLSLLRAIALHEPTPPRQLDAAVPRPLSDLIGRLLEKDPVQRFASAAQVLHAFQNLDQDADTQVMPACDKPTGLPTKALLPCMKRPLHKNARVWLLAMAGAVAALAAAIVLFWPTSSGTVRIEINDPAIKVAIDKDEFKIQGADKHEITLTSGEHGLRIKHGDKVIQTTQFLLHKGETVTLKIDVLPGKVQVVQGDKVISENPLPPAPKKPPAPKFKSAEGNFALRFEGDDSVQIADVPFDQTGPYTLEAFVTPLKKAENRATILGQGRNLNLEISVYRVPFPTWRYSWRFPHNLGTDEVVIDQRVHLAAVHDGQQVRLYLNGKLSASRDGIQLPPGEDKITLLIGPGFFGLIDEARVSKVARYKEDFAPVLRFQPDAGTVALWHFDEGKGAILRDSSGHNHHGTITGAKWVMADGRTIK